jgi:prepilin signal peptidase PulO-like enzyme (type II secretory pathway)
MISILTGYFFLLGLIVGSFLNVVLYRFNTGRGLGGRSGCMMCRRTLSWVELIPVLSWMIQKGRCKGCKSKISIQYPLIELTTGILFAGNFLFILHSVSSIVELITITFLTTLLWVFFILVFVYDIKHKIIPNFFSFSLWGISIILISISKLFFTPSSLTLSDNLFSIFYHIGTGLFFYSIVWLLWKISKGKLIGLGDAKLLLSIGTILGFVLGFSAIFVAAWVGTFYSLYILAVSRLSKKHKHITMKTEIPLGPFLIIGFLIVYFANIDITNLGLIFNYYELQY